MAQVKAKLSRGQLVARLKKLWNIRQAAQEEKALKVEVLEELEVAGVVKFSDLVAFVMESKRKAYDPETVYKRLTEDQRKKFFEMVSVSAGAVDKILGKGFLKALPASASQEKIVKSIIIKGSDGLNKNEEAQFKAICVKRRIQL